MKPPKIVALLLILGMLLQGVSFPQTAQGIFREPMEAAPKVNSRAGLPSVQGSETSIDAFSVHPANRWDSATSGLQIETLTNGELEWQGLINDSATMERYRNAATLADTIAARWRLNATADFATNETDWATQNNVSAGADGWSWEEFTDDGWESLSGGVLTATQGTLKISRVPLDNAWGAEVTGLAINGDLFNQLEVRARGTGADQEDFFFQFRGSGGVDGTTLQAGAMPADWTVYTFNLSTIAAWAGDIITDLEPLWETVGNGEVELDYVRIYGDDEYPGDFEIPIMGLNVTTDEGSGNSSLNAYPWNTTHYVLRPTFTTDDGTAWRSWNIESDYQDYAQMDGTYGADGWEFLEGTLDGWIGHVAAASATDLGYIEVEDVGVAGFKIVFTNAIDTSLFPGAAQFKIFSNISVAGCTFQDQDAPFNEFTAQFSLSVGWNTFNLTFDSDWTSTQDDILIRIPAATAGLYRLDYVRLTSENSSSDLTFFEYETYYRTEMDYNLRRSELSFIVLDDTDDDLVEEVIGTFGIASFFDTKDLVPDVFQAEMGATNYLFASRGAGANVTMTWDYYEAEFSAFLWTENFKSAVQTSWLATSPYASYGESIGAGPPQQLILRYDLVVPELDGMAGSFSLDEITGNLMYSTIKLEVFSVTTATGALVEEIEILIEGGDNGPGTADNSHHINPTTDGVLQSIYTTGGLTVNSSETSFSFLMNKEERTLALQMKVEDNNSKIRNLAYSAAVAAGQSNEFLLRLEYQCNFLQVGFLDEIFFALDEWALTFRDLFGGIKLPLPDLDDIVGGGGGIFGGVFDFLLAPLVAILNGVLAIPKGLVEIVSAIGQLLDIMDLVKGVLDAISSGITAIGSAVDGLEGLIGTLTTAVEAIGSAITASVDAIGSAITASVDAIGAAITAAVDLVTDAIEAMELVIETALEAVEDAVDLVTDAVDLVTAALALLAAQIIDLLVTTISDIVDEVLDILSTIWTAIVTEIRAISIQGVNVGGVLDVIFSYLGLFTATATTTLAFLIMIVTEWSLIFMVFLFLAILFFSIGASQTPGELFGNIFKAYSVNTLPFSVFGFRMHVPLAVWNLPFIAIVVLGIA